MASRMRIEGEAKSQREMSRRIRDAEVTVEKKKAEVESLQELVRILKSEGVTDANRLVLESAEKDASIAALKLEV